MAKASHGTDALSSDERLAHAIKARYGLDNQATSSVWFKAAQMLDHEMGLGPYKNRLSPAAGELPQMDLMGAYTPDDNRIRLASDLTPDERLSTLAHEMGHAADHAFGGNYDHPIDEKKGMPHHRFYKDFESELAHGMEEQKLREAGLPLDQQLAPTYPWLKNVKPESSNPLATPWTPGPKTESPWIWNLGDY